MSSTSTSTPTPDPDFVLDDDALRAVLTAASRPHRLGPVAASLVAATADEGRYLAALRDAVRGALDTGQGLSGAVPAIMAAMAPLAPGWADFEATTARNAAAAWAEMEWE